MALQENGVFLYQRFLRKGATLILAFSWIGGLASGVLLFFRADASVISLMRRCCFTSVSIVWFAALSILPFLFSAFAVFLSFPWMLYPVCYLKGLCYGFVIAGLDYLWGASSWLVRLAVLFDDILLVPLLFWFWIRHVSGERKCSIRECVLFLISGGLVSVGVNRQIMPFFAEIFIL